MTPLERELDPSKDWRTAYPYVEALARIVLDVLPEGAHISTTELVDRICGQPADPQVRNRVFKAIRAAAQRGLVRYVTKGEPEKIGHIEAARRLHWHRGLAEVIPVKSVCPTCKRPL